MQDAGNFPLSVFLRSLHPVSTLILTVILWPYSFHTYDDAEDLSRYSILHNHGLIGDGKIAFADSLDLALG